MNKRQKKKKRPAALPETEKEYSNEQLVQRIKDGTDRHGEAMLQLLEKNRGFCFLVARPFLIAKSVEPEEIPSISFLAVSNAIDYFNPSYGTGFTTVLKPFLLRELLQTVNNAAPISLPRNLRTALNKYKRFTEEYRTVNGILPPDEIVIAELKITPLELENIKLAAISQQTPISLDQNIHDSEDDAMDLTILDTLIDNKTDVEGAGLQSDLYSAVQQVLASLPDQERQEVQNRYFFDEPVTDPKVLQSGMKKLRAPASSNKLRAFIYSEGLKGTGFAKFAQTGFSSTERTAIQRYKGQGE